MKITLDGKYKTREPKDTIEIIESFFKKKNCELRRYSYGESEIGTYFCKYALIFHDKAILEASGKGTTEEFAKASAYGEMYERFCATWPICHNAVNYQNLIRKNYMHFGYYVDPEEKEINLNETLATDLGKYALMDAIPSLDEKYIKKFLSMKFGDRVLATKYININPNSPNKDFYFNSVLATYLMGSTGLAAGNSLEEALIEGISEIYEREVHLRFLLEEQNRYYYLNNDILPDYIKQYIKKLKDKGFDTYIYDLSYNFSMPVCVVYIINKTTNRLFSHFGASPNITIAIERCLTELYQGIVSVTLDDQRKYLVTKEANSGDNIIATMSSGRYSSEPIIENMFLNSQQINHYNDLIFNAQDECDIQEVMNQIYRINKINNIELYYKDISLCGEVVAIHIISKEAVGNVTTPSIEEDKKTSEENEKIYYDACEISLDLINKLKQITKDNIPISSEELDKYIDKICSYIPTNSYADQNLFFQLLTKFIPQEYLNPFKCQDRGGNANEPLINFLLGDFQNITIDTGTDFGKNLLPWLFFYSYCIVNKKDLETCNKLLAKIGYPPIKVDLNNFKPIDYINEAIVKNFQKVYNSEQYNEFLNLFIKNEEN